MPSEGAPSSLPAESCPRGGTPRARLQELALLVPQPGHVASRRWEINVCTQTAGSVVFSRGCGGCWCSGSVISPHSAHPQKGGRLVWDTLLGPVLGQPLSPWVSHAQPRVGPGVQERTRCRRALGTQAGALAGSLGPSGSGASPGPRRERESTFRWKEGPGLREVGAWSVVGSPPPLPPGSHPPYTLDLTAPAYTLDPTPVIRWLAPPSTLDPTSLYPGSNPCYTLARTPLH